MSGVHLQLDKRMQIHHNEAGFGCFLDQEWHKSHFVAAPCSCSKYFVLYCHLVSIGCPSRTPASRICAGDCTTVEGLFDLTFRAYRMEVEIPEKSKRCQEGRRGCDWTGWCYKGRDECIKRRGRDTVRKKTRQRGGGNARGRLKTV